MKSLTPSQEHYLRAILMQSSGENGARICDVAENLGVSKPSVCTAVKTLERMNLVKRDVQRQIFLTPKREKPSVSDYEQAFDCSMLSH